MARTVWLLLAGALAGSALTLIVMTILSSDALDYRPMTGPVAIVSPSAAKHGFLGVAFSNERSRSLYVAEVMRTGAADAAALAAGDRVIAFNGQPVSEIAELQRLLSATKPGDVVKLDVMRGEQTITLDVRLMSAHEISAALEGSPLTAP